MRNSKLWAIRLYEDRSTIFTESSGPAGAVLAILMVPPALTEALAPTLAPTPVAWVAEPLPELARLLAPPQAARAAVDRPRVSPSWTN